MTLPSTEGTGLEQAERNWPRVGFPCWTWVGEPTLDMDLLNAVSTTVKESHCKRHPILIPFEKKIIRGRITRTQIEII